MYRIVRFYKDADVNREVIETGLTLEEARAHCNNPETSSSTAKSSWAQAITDKMGQWFDGYEEDE